MSEDLTQKSIAISFKPSSALEYANLGSMYASQQQWQQAIAAYQQALDLDSQLGGVYRNLAKIFHRLGKPKQADLYWFKAAKIEPNSLSATEYVALGDRLLGQQRPSQAIFCWRQAIAIEPKYFEVYYKLSVELSKLDKHQPAVAIAHQAIKQDQDNPTSYYYLALAKQKQGKIPQAIVNYRRAIKLNSSFIRARIKLAGLLTGEQKWQQALVHYQHLIKLEPDNSRFYHLLGNYWVKRQNWSKAQQAYQQAVKHNSQAVQSWYNLGSVARRQQSWALAQQAYKQVIRQDYRVSELVVKATNYSYSLLAQNSAATADDYYQLGQLFRSRSQFEAAIKCFCAAIKLDPCYLKAYNTIQYTPVPPQQLKFLINFYRQILNRKPNYPIIWGNLGDALSQSGDIEAAIECYQRSSYLNAVAAKPEIATQIDFNTPKTQAPDFIIIGVAKGGTSSLYYYLGQHPQLILPHKKEINFFSRGFDYGKDWYLSHFPSITDWIGADGVAGQNLSNGQTEYPINTANSLSGIGDRTRWFTGEASPNYFSFIVAAERIAQTFPKAKLILLLRNPVDRAISWHYHKLNSGLTKLDLATAITKEMQQIKNLNPHQLCLNGYRPLDNVLRSIYVYQLQQWRKYFSAEQILILKSEDLYSKPALIMKEVFDFVGLPPYEVDDYPVCNIGSYQLPDQSIKEQLKAFFQPFNQELESYLNRQFNWD